MGEQLAFASLTSESLRDTIISVGSDPKYKENAQKASRLMRDTPMDPRDTFLYWINFVIRHKGAPHLQPQAVHKLAWYQYFFLDVVLFVCVLILITTITVVFLLWLVVKDIKKFYNRKFKKEE